MIGTCIFCQTEYKYKPSQQAGKYCSNKCQRSYQHEEKIKAWLAGEITLNTVNVSKYIRNHLLDKCGNKCSKCGWCEIHPVTGKVPLEINHIDGNATNNIPENMEVLCPNCHSLTPTYKNLNKGFGRSKRPCSSVGRAPHL